MDDIDRGLLALLQEDATRTYAELGKEVGLSAGAAHERVRKLRATGVIRRTTVDIDPVAVDLDVLAFVTVDSVAWMGDSAPFFAAIPEIQEAHVIAGTASILLKVRTGSTAAMQDVLRRVHAITGVSSTQATMVLETFFERPIPTGDTST
ncbi:Lrp/AsnC family transcriptional regulator (plasmid) [Embleya sp. NBC_00888]|uniref:Lrp/AsnC family transcriptional regulator n=1 Tax=Embleya sp. NBC_00888 TaxID=2975960 RepID=UPI002F917A80|nr:Lrp/AsnC family transcriptional regulator [Embleya sp. NBC_00888]